MSTTDDIKKDDLLTEIRTRFTEFHQYWAENLKQGDLDIEAISLRGPWPEGEPERRKAEGRLCEHNDIISQYNRRLNNQGELSARGIKIEPAGEKATPETAGRREDRIRQIEYESNAKYARGNARELAIDRAMGYYIIRTDYVSPESFDQKIIIDAILNPKSVLIWPYCKTPDRSDQMASFVVERYDHDIFRQKWPRAERKTFGNELISLAPQWINNKDVQVASYFKVEMKERHRLRIQGPEGKTMDVFADDIPDATVKGDRLVLDGNSVPILKEKWAQFPKVKQYMTNGVELLDTKDWIGSMIPIICVFGKEKYGPDGKLIVESATRKARGAQLAYDFAWTTKLEKIGQAPKTKIFMYEGQQETSTDHENLNRTYTSYATFKATTSATGATVLPLPEVREFNYDVSPMIMVEQAAMMAVENAYGISSGQHQDKVAKSGKTIEKLNENADLTNNHFQEASDRALLLEGRMVNEILDKVEDTDAVRGFRSSEGNYTAKPVTPKADENGEIVDHPYGDAAAHDVTVSIQKQYGSQFEKYAESLDALAVDPTYGPLLVPLIIKARELGPLGDKMYELAKSIMSPQAQKILDGDDGNKEADMAQLQQQAEQMNQMLQMATEQVNALKEQITAKDAELQMKLKVAELDSATKVTVAQIGAKVEKSSQDLEMFMQKMDHTIQLILQSGSQQHEALTQGASQEHEAGQQDQQLSHAADQAAQQADLQREQAEQQLSRE